MVFHPSFRIGTIFAFLLSIAFLGNLGGPSTSLLVAAADDLQCRVSFEFSTFHDEDLDLEDLPVPDADLLPDAILNLFKEEFRMYVGEDYKMIQNVFKSYELRGDELDLLNNAPSTASLEDPSIRRILYKCFDWAITDDFSLTDDTRKHAFLTLSNDHWADVMIGFCNMCEEDDDTYAKRWREGEFDPEKQKQKQKEKEKQEKLEKEKQKQKQKEKEKKKFTTWRKNKRRKNRYGKRQLTVDHFNEGLTDGDVMLESTPSHDAFEEHFCNELRKLHEIFPIFETSDNCKITFHCGDDGEEGEEDQELVVYDYRDFDASEFIDQYGEEELEGLPLYLITTVH